MSKLHFAATDGGKTVIGPTATDFPSLEAAIAGAANWAERLRIEGEERAEDHSDWIIEISDDHGRPLWRKSVAEILSGLP